MVYATGTNTYFGKTAQLVEQAHTVSHFQKAVMKIGDYLIILAVALVAVILVVALFRGDKMCIRDRAIEDIREIQKNAREQNDTTRPRWPMIVLRSPKGWTGPQVVDEMCIRDRSRTGHLS